MWKDLLGQIPVPGIYLGQHHESPTTILRAGDESSRTARREPNVSPALHNVSFYKNRLVSKIWILILEYKRAPGSVQAGTESSGFATVDSHCVCGSQHLRVSPPSLPSQRPPASPRRPEIAPSEGGTKG